jgi:hypothetical protein
MQFFLTKCLYVSIYLISIFAVRLLFVFRDVSIYVICLSLSLSFSLSLCPSVSLPFYVTVFLLCFQLYLSVLSFCSVFLFCLSVLSFCSVFLFCLSVLSFCSVFLFCLSVLSFCLFKRFSCLLFFFLSVCIFLFTGSCVHFDTQVSIDPQITISTPQLSSDVISSDHFFLLMIGATKIVTNMGTFTSFR